MKKTVFLTGATGVMGWAGLQELLKKQDQYNVVVLARKSEKNVQKLSPLMDRIKVVWGDLTRYEDVLAWSPLPPTTIPRRRCTSM